MHDDRGAFVICDEAHIALMRRAFSVLARSEGFFAARAFSEATSPPFEPGRCAYELRDVRDLLAEMQRTLRSFD